MATSDNHQPKHEEIALRAFQLWTQEGHPMGSDQRHWHQAEAELKNKGRSLPPQPLPPAPKNARPQWCEAALNPLPPSAVIYP